MDGAGLAIAGFLIQMVINLLALGHFSGKSEQRLNNHDAQIKEVHALTLKNYSDMSKHQQFHNDLKTKVAENDARFTENITSMRDDMKEMKDTLKEFTKEMRDWGREMQKKAS